MTTSQVVGLASTSLISSILSIRGLTPIRDLESQRRGMTAAPLRKQCREVVCGSDQSADVVSRFVGLAPCGNR